MTPTAAWAQETALLSGTIADASGALLPGVEVTATNTATNTVRMTVSNETGSYVLTNLPLGPYTLEATLPGFSVFSQRGIVLQVGDNRVINAVLQVGAITETIEVQANAALVETRNTGIGQILDNVRVLELPLNGRQVSELITLSGAVTTAPIAGVDRNYPTLAISVGGGHDNMLTYRMDGGTHNDPYNNLNMPLPFPDALQEFKVETSAVPARNGGHSAGVVSVVTKSGTNAFHGDAFEFVRNEVFNARNTFATGRDSLKRNQLGGTLGGPVVRNKLFFFGGYQRTYKRSAPSESFMFLPTQEVLNGDFRRIASEECRGPGRGITLAGSTAALRTAFPFVNNQIDPARFSPAVTRIVARLPKTTDPCGRVDFSKSKSEDEHQFISRVDYQQSSNHSIFVRHTLHWLKTPSDFDKIALDVNNADWNRQYQSGAIGDTWSISGNLVNSFRVTGIRTANTKSFPDQFSPAEVGITNLVYPAPPFPKVFLLNVVDAFQTIANTATPSFTNSTGFEISEDLGWVKGNHQFAFGGSFMRQIMYVSAATSSPGEWSVQNTGTGLSMADLMIGYVDQFRNESVSTWYPRQDFRSVFAQDTWKVNSRFTLNYGLRWEPFTPQVRTDKRSGTFRRDWFQQGVTSKVFLNAPKGFLYSGGDRPNGVPGDQGMPDTARISNNLWARFAPRVGTAWDVAGDGRTSIRAAYGLFFDYPHVYQFNGIRNTPPYDPRVIRRRYLGGFDDPWTGFAGGNPYPIAITQNLTFPDGALFQQIDANFRPPYVHQWNLSLQRQLGGPWVATANYLGNSTIHLLNVRDANPLIAGVRDLTRLDPTSPYSSSINKYDDGGLANYNALWVSLERQSANLNLRMNYTWSHCIDDATFFNSGSTGKTSIYRRHAERGNCDLDRRHLFNLSTVYATPTFANPVARALGSGWRVSGIVKRLSGSYFSVLCGCDRAVTQEAAQNANQLMSNVLAKQGTTYLNTAAFALPAQGTYGNMGRNTIQGPGIFTLDMGLTRRFEITESQAVEFRAEVFNLPNHVNLENPSNSLSSSTFGRITAAGDPRIMQFALKYVF